MGNRSSLHSRTDDMLNESGHAPSRTTIHRTAGSPSSALRVRSDGELPVILFVLPFLLECDCLSMLLQVHFFKRLDAQRVLCNGQCRL